MQKEPANSPHPLAESWLRVISAEGPLDRSRAGASIRAIYRIAGEPEPHAWLWLDTPANAASIISWILTQQNLSQSLELRQYWEARYAKKFTKDRDFQKVLPALTDLGGPEALGEPWRINAEDCPPRRLWKALHPAGGPLSNDAETEQIRADIGRGVLSHLSSQGGRSRQLRGFKRGSQPLVKALLAAADSRWRSTVIELCWWSYFPHSELAVVDCWNRRRQAEVDEAVAEAIKEVSQTTWLWWPFERGAILCDRPPGQWWRSR